MVLYALPEPPIHDDRELINSLVMSLRGPGGLGMVRQRLSAMRPGATVDLDGLPAPLALIMAGHNGGWMEQSLLSETGRSIDSKLRVWKVGLARRHLALMRWAAQWSDAEQRKDMLALGWLVLVEKIAHPEPGIRGDNNAAARLAWTQALESAQALCARHGLPEGKALLARASSQLVIRSQSTPEGSRESHRWGRSTPRVALLCARAFPPGHGREGECFWLAALDVLHRTATGWNPIRDPYVRRYIAGPTIAAIAGRLDHPQSRNPPADTRAWVEALGADAATEALVQCWMVACQPQNPAVPLPEDIGFDLAPEWGAAVLRHLQDHPAQALRLPGLVRDLSWKGCPVWPGLSALVRQAVLDLALPESKNSPAKSVAPRL